MKRILLILGLMALGSTAWAMGAVDPVFPDVKALSSTPLNARVLKTTEKDGIVIEEVMYHSEMDGTNSVEIFGFFGYPKGGKRLPAFVWNQSSMAPADITYVEIGAKRGYAVVCIDFPMPGYRSTGGYPIAGLVVGEDPPKAPLAHAVIALLKAVTFLESRPEVDRDRIGMAGASWGGFMTTLMVGVDPRLKVGSCFFGTGNLQLGCSWFEGPCADPVYAERWRTTLDPGWRLANVKTPISWCTGSNDHFYWMPALMATYAMAGGPKHLGLIANWDHGLPPALDDEVLGWLDVYLQNKPAYPQLTPVTVRKSGQSLEASWSFSAPPERKIATADLMLSYGEPGNWPSRYWLTLPVRRAGTNCTAVLPASAVPYFISGTVVEENGYRHSTPLRLVDPRQHGRAGAVPAVDSLADWGGFETGFPAYLYATPPLPTAAEARSGKKSLALKPGRLVFPPVQFIAGLRYELTGYLKADQPTAVILQLAGRFDRRQQTEELTVKVGPTWTPFRLEYATLAAMMTDLKLAITTPPGGTVLLDDLSFRPVADRP